MANYSDTFGFLLFEAQQQATELGGTTAVKQINMAAVFHGPDKDAMETMRDYSFQFSQKTVERVRGDVNSVIVKGLEEGKSQNDIRKDLDTVFINMEKYEVERIARTEIARGVSNGALMGYRQMDIQFVEHYANAGACALCDSMTGEIYEVERADNIIPVHPNCYCFYVPRPDLNKEL